MAAGLNDRALYTIGHGAAALDDFLAYVRDAGIEAIVDVRRFPASRRHPHFASAALANELGNAGVAYRHAADLGGRRPARKDSPNTGLRNAGFRGYADWMQGDAFRATFGELVDEARRVRTAVMCAETPWWKCHRRLIADAALLLSGLPVVHVMGEKRSGHVPTGGVVAEEGLLFYR